MAAPSSDYNVAALGKGLRVLSIFSEQRRQIRAVEAAELTNLPVPTVFRLLKTLEAEGYVEQLPDSRFVPTAAVLRLGYAALRTVDVVDASEHPLRRLADVTGETVNLGVLMDIGVLYLRRITGGSLVTANVQVGSVLPAASTSMGKVLLAHLPGKELQGRLRRLDYDALEGPNAIKNPRGLRKALETVREQGWAAQDEELAAGIRGVAVPVRDETGSVVAAMNVAVNAAQWSADALLERSLSPLRAAAEETSARLGYATRAELGSIGVPTPLPA